MTEPEIIFNMLNSEEFPGGKIIRYVHGLIDRRYYFYQGDGAQCLPVDYSENKISINVVNKEFLKPSSSDKSFTKIVDELKKSGQGQYIADFRTGKIIYDLNYNYCQEGFEEEIPKSKYSIYITTAIEDYSGKEIICYLIPGNVVGLLNLARYGTASRKLIKGKPTTPFGRKFFFELMAKFNLITTDLPTYAELNEFAKPVRTIDVSETIFGKLIDEVDKEFSSTEEIVSNVKSIMKENKKVEKFSIPFSEIINKGIKHLESGKIFIIDFDIRYEDIQLESGMVKNDTVYLYFSKVIETEEYDELLERIGIPGAILIGRK